MITTCLLGYCYLKAKLQLPPPSKQPETCKLYFAAAPQNPRLRGWRGNGPQNEVKTDPDELFKSWMIFWCGLDIARVHLIIAVCDGAFSTGLPPRKVERTQQIPHVRMLGSWSRLRCHFPHKKKMAALRKWSTSASPLWNRFVRTSTYPSWAAPGSK